MFDAPTTSDRERKQLLRAILTDVVVTVDREAEQHAAELRVVWEGGAVTEHTVPLPRTGSHTRCTDQDTIALVRQLAERYPDKQIAAILARQGRRTGAGNPFTAHRVAGLRAHHKIPAAPVRATRSRWRRWSPIAKAASELGVSTATVHRWLREGFIAGEQITPGAPWQIRLTDELRDRVCEQAPDGWLPLADAAEALGVARQTVLHKVQRGELAAVYVHRGKRKGLRIQVKPDQAGLFDNHVRRGGAVLNQRHLLDVPRVDEHQLEVVLEHRPHRLPVDAGRLHRDLLDAERLQPVAQRQQALNRRGELRDVLLELALVPDAHARRHARLVYIQRAWALDDPLHLRPPPDRSANDRRPRELRTYKAML